MEERRQGATPWQQEMPGVTPGNRRCRATSQGDVPLTRAAENLNDLTSGMEYSIGSPAWNMWARHSRTWAMGVPKNSTVHVFLNNPNPNGILDASGKEDLAGKRRDNH